MLSRVEQGHPGSTMSQIELMIYLFYGGVLNYQYGNPGSSNRDRVIVSKGHAAMGLYPILADIGYFDKRELELFGTPEGILKIFANTTIPGIDATTGSLGHGLGIAVGYALADKMDNKAVRTYVIISEGELYEGSTWESALLATHHKLSNVVLIIDRNRNIILGDTEDLVKLEPLNQKLVSFGFEVVEADGHDFIALASAFDQMSAIHDRPTALIAHTIKGQGVSIMKGDPFWHYWQKISKESIEQVASELKAYEDSL